MWRWLQARGTRRTAGDNATVAGGPAETRANQGERNMERRKFLLGAGSAAVGASAIVGSGAFSSVQADRALNLNVVTDDDAYLTLMPSGCPNGAYADLNAGAPHDQGRLSLVFDSLNSKAENYFDNVFKVQNEGTQQVFFSGIYGGDGSIGNNDNEVEVWLYPSSQNSCQNPDPSNTRQARLNGNDNVLRVQHGEVQEIGVAIITGAGFPRFNGGGPQSDQLLVRADDRNAGTNVIQDVGDV